VQGSTVSTLGSVPNARGVQWNALGTSVFALQTASTPGPVSQLTYPGGVSSSFTGNSFNTPFRLTYDNSSVNLLVANTFSHNILSVSPAGVVSAFAGSPAGTSGSADGFGTNARFTFPEGVAVDALNVVYVADFNHLIRRIESRWVTTIAGSAGKSGFANGYGVAATFFNPRALVVNGGNLIVSDSSNHAIRQLTCQPCPAGYFCSSGAPVICPAGSLLPPLLRHSHSSAPRVPTAPPLAHPPARPALPRRGMGAPRAPHPAQQLFAPLAATALGAPLRQ
jgi:hypothetical protein